MPSVDRRPTAVLPLPVRVMRIGRTSDNDLAIDDLGVSRRHAEMRKSASGRYEIIDLGSHYGTFLNGAWVNRAGIGDEDIIGIGHATFRLADGELRLRRLAPPRPPPPGRRPARRNAFRQN